MPKIEVNEKLFFNAIGKKYSYSELEDVFPCAKAELDEKPDMTQSDDERVIKIELFHQTGNSYTIDLYSSYKTDNPDEEALCPFLKDKSGCILPSELKPFDCSIWPFRIVKKDKLWLCLTPTCSTINKIPLETVTNFAKTELKQKVIDYVQKNPQIIKKDSDFFVPLFPLE